MKTFCTAVFFISFLLKKGDDIEKHIWRFKNDKGSDYVELIFDNKSNSYISGYYYGSFFYNDSSLIYYTSVIAPMVKSAGSIEFIVKDCNYFSKEISPLNSDKSLDEKLSVNYKLPPYFFWGKLSDSFLYLKKRIVYGSSAFDSMKFERFR